MQNNMRSIPGIEHYLACSSGRLFSLRKKKYLKPYNNNSGYPTVSIWEQGKRSTELVSRFIAKAFVPNPNNKPTVNHKDGIKTNNAPANLEWATRSENSQHMIDNGLSHWSEKRIPIDVYDYGSGEFMSHHVSLNDAARVYGLHENAISMVLNGIRKHTKGLTFIKA